GQQLLFPRAWFENSKPPPPQNKSPAPHRTTPATRTSPASTVDPRTAADNASQTQAASNSLCRPPVSPVGPCWPQGPSPAMALQFAAIVLPPQAKHFPIRPAHHRQPPGASAAARSASLPIH